MGHITKELSRLACHFIRRGRHITCKVIGQRTRFLLIQDGLEIPCIAQFAVAPKNEPLLQRLIE